MRTTTACRRCAAVGAGLVALATVATPAGALDQAVVHAGSIQIAISMLPQEAQDSPSGLRSAGQRIASLVWSATDAHAATATRAPGGACFVAPPVERPPSQDACALTVDELLSAGAPARPAGPGDLSDLIGAIQGLEKALQMRPGPTASAKLTKEAVDAYAKGNAEQALAKAKQALDASIERLGGHSPETAVSLSLIGRMCTALGRTTQTAGVLDEALRISRKANAGRDNRTAAILDAKGQLLRQKGKYEAAVGAFEEALAIYRAAANDERDIARLLNQLAIAHEEMGDRDEALELYRRGLTLARSALGKDDRELLTIQANLGGLERRHGELDKAGADLGNALAIEVQAGRGGGPGAAAIRNQLGLLHHDRGDYDRAERLFEEAKRAAEALPGSSHLLSAAIRNNLALLDLDRGDRESALQLLKAAVAEQARFGDVNTPRSATLLHNLADVYAVQGRTECAGPLYEQAAGTWDRIFGPDHLDSLRTAVSLAAIDRQRGDLIAAEHRLRSTVGRLEKHLGPDHPELGKAKNNLAEVLRLEGRGSEAAELYDSALSGIERAFGRYHPDTATVLFNRAVLEWQGGAIADAVRRTASAVERREHAAGIVLVYGSEEQKRAFARTLASETAAVISLQAGAPRDLRARTLAIESIVRRKGRVLEAAAGAVAASGGDPDPETQALVAAWRAARGKLAALLLDPSPAAGAVERAGTLDEEIQQIERHLSRRSASIVAAAEQVDLGALRGRIPDDAALIELVVYAPFAPLARAAAPTRYAAFVLRAKGEAAFVDLGEAAPIDAAVRDLRRAINYSADPEFGPTMRERARKLAHSLNDILMAPLGPFIADARLLLVAPDGALNVLSFDLLRDAEGHFFVERHELAYLTAGRDLLRVPGAAPSREPPLVIGDPDFGSADSAAVLKECTFDPLPGARDEVGRIASLLGDARVLVGGEASETTLKAARGPRILHLATHGFFAEEGNRCISGGTSHGTSSAEPETIAASLVRSGLALARFNRRERGGRGRGPDRA